MRGLFLIVSHCAMLAVGFALGVYLLPILTAPPSPDRADLAAMAEGASYTTEFTRDRRGSDFLHWGEGMVSLTASDIVHEGKLAPGPDYKLYLVNGYVDHEDGFVPVKSSALQVGDVKSCAGFSLPLPEGVDLEAYDTVVIWCEAFGEFITSAQYR